jgi:hypothetical protein
MPRAGPPDAGAHRAPGLLQNGWQTPLEHASPAAQSVPLAQSDPLSPVPTAMQAATPVGKAHFSPDGHPHGGSTWQAAPEGGVQLPPPPELPELVPEPELLLEPPPELPEPLLDTAPPLLDAVPVPPWQLQAS